LIFFSYAKTCARRQKRRRTNSPFVDEQDKQSEFFRAQPNSVAHRSCNHDAAGAWLRVSPRRTKKKSVDEDRAFDFGVTSLSRAIKIAQRAAKVIRFRGALRG
jgi:hypothetical protein